MAYQNVYGGGSQPIIYPPYETSVWVKDYWADPWTWIPYLTAKTATAGASPNESSATIEFDFGYIEREGPVAWDYYTPTDLRGCYVAIQFHNWYGTIPVWIGVIPHENDTSDGTTGYPQGVQVIKAAGLDYILDRVQIEGSYTDNGWINRDLGYNQRDRHRGRANFGNRSTSPDVDGAHMFSADDEEWSNLDIADTLVLKYTDSTLPVYVTGTIDALQTITEEHDLSGLTLRAALNRLIDRRRAVGWRITTAGNPGDPIYVDVFSVLATGLHVGPHYIPPNWDQHTIDLEGLIDAKPTFHFSNAHCYDSVVVRGGPLYSCFSLDFDNGTLEEGWDATDETTYKDGSSKGSPTTEDHDLARKEDALDNVYRLFRVPDAFAWTVHDTPVNAAPSVLADGTIDAAVQATTFNPGHVFEREIPFEENNSGTDAQPNYRKAFAAIKDSNNDWHFVDKLADEDGNELHVGMSVSDREMAVTLMTPLGHILAENHWSGAEDSNAEPIVDYEDLIATVMTETDERLRVEYQLGLRPPGDQWEAKIIEVPDAVAWYVVPNTVEDVEDGAKTYHTGGLVRDDTDRLRGVAAFAAAWYGQAQATVSVTFDTITTEFPLGALISNAAGAWHNFQIGTVVSSVTWDFDSQKTEISTGYTELDLADMGGA